MEKEKNIREEENIFIPKDLTVAHSTPDGKIYEISSLVEIDGLPFYVRAWNTSKSNDRLNLTLHKPYTPDKILPEIYKGKRDISHLEKISNFLNIELEENSPPEKIVTSIEGSVNSEEAQAQYRSFYEELDNPTKKQNYINYIKKSFRIEFEGEDS